MVRLEQLKRDEANQHDNTQGVGGSAASSVPTRSGRRQGQDPRRVCGPHWRPPETRHTDIGRQIDQFAESRQDAAKDLMHRVNRILTQTNKDKNKLYALHAPEVECISKGKAPTPYEFGVKVTVATTLKEGFVVRTQSMPSNPYDGLTLEKAIKQVCILAEQTPKIVIVDRGYQGAELEGIRILRSGQKRGISRTLHAMIKRRSAIEPTIGHMKTDGRLGRTR